MYMYVNIRQSLLFLDQMEPGNYICDGPRQLHFLCFQMIKGFCSEL